ncbi:hypothetical protein PC110_g3044 [Phytophthora cactorum]|uniref:Uncharacterized protein n=3 Tax=Phytophthora cactorum TaxID=29920 RepID=A0A329SV64_9STRA|nr:hypothetical protein PC110_g3044 [Phytophthora cactorum]
MVLSLRRLAARCSRRLRSLSTVPQRIRRGHACVSSLSLWHSPEASPSKRALEVDVSRSKRAPQLRTPHTCCYNRREGSIVNYVHRSFLNLFSWLEGMLKNNLPLSFCENEAARRYSNLDPICVKMLISGMATLTCAVKRIIGTELPDRFGLILDGWTHASEHYIAVYARYEVGGVIKTPPAL